MDFILEPLKLSTGMDGLALASVSILVKDGNHRTALGLNNTTSSDQRKVGDLMTIYSTHINSARRCRAVYDTDVSTSKATISTMVDQRSKRRGLVLGDVVSHMVHIDLMVVLLKMLKLWV